MYSSFGCSQLGLQELEEYSLACLATDLRSPSADSRAADNLEGYLFQTS